MFIPSQHSSFTDLDKYYEYKYLADQYPTTDTIGMIIGVSLCSIFLILFFVYIAYYLAWFSCYELFCYRWANSICCNCIRCYFYCPCMDSRALKNSQLNSSVNGGKMFVQDLLAGPDGSIIHLSDIRPVNNCHNMNYGMNSNTRNFQIENESELI